MSDNGGTPQGPDGPTDFVLRPPRAPRDGAPHASYDGAPDAPHATPTQVVPPARTVRPPAPAAPEQQRDPGAGRLIGGRYRLLARLGHGGMGTVWRAGDETVDREVAVKEPRVPDHLPERERANVFERMRREARAAARLDHPAVVNVHDVVDVDGRPWIVMELVRGRSLGDALQEGTLDAREAARIGLEVLGALEAAHAAGVLHRDVKPDNILLGRYGRVVLTDFGIARTEGETSLTDTGGFVGSPEFVAPERVLGRQPGPASDLWSLGVVLYAATEGVSPFRRSNTPATLQSVLNTVPAAPSAAKGPLADAINGLLAKDPARRPDAGRVRALLERAAGPPAETRAVRAAGPGGRGVRLGRTAWLGAGAAVVAAAAVAYLLVADPFAGPLPDGWKERRVTELGATVAVPAGYRRSVPDADAPEDEHWVRYTDPSGSLWVGLTLARKAEDSGGGIAGTAAAEMYDDNEEFKRSGDYGLGMAADPAPRSDPRETTYKGRRAARNTVVYSTTDTQDPLPRELQLLYYRTGAGDLYKLMIGYPGKGDFTERGREVARTAVANLDLDKP
ncbi:serine/threonine-protein kinase [Streptomyces minutiscleroticus]|uniref:serine/threonine-protein kinase n=1 Tax=Streptomyces minutiscleroticus TaxID=68238 RepID=UPI0033258C85